MVTETAIVKVLIRNLVQAKKCHHDSATSAVLKSREKTSPRSKKKRKTRLDNVPEWIDCSPRLANSRSGPILHPVKEVKAAAGKTRVKARTPTPKIK